MRYELVPVFCYIAAFHMFVQTTELFYFCCALCTSPYMILCCVNGRQKLLEDYLALLVRGCRLPLLEYTGWEMLEFVTL